MESKISFEDFENIVKEIDEKKYYISRTVKLGKDGLELDSWIIFKREVNIDEYLSSNNPPLLSSHNNNTLEDIKKLIAKE